MKGEMALVPRFLIPLCVLAYLPAACSSTDDGTKPAPAPPGTAGTASTAGSGGSATGGTGGGTLTAGSGGMSSTGGGSHDVPIGMPCTGTPQCQAIDSFCNAMKVCGCSADKPDVCGTGATAACVFKQTSPDNCGVCGTACDAGATCVAGKCGTKPTELLPKGAGCGAMQLVVQGGTVYWTEAMSGKVRSMPVAGGAPTDIATGQMAPSAIVADAKGVYWVNTGNNKIMKVALPVVAGAPEELKAAEGADKVFGIAVAMDKLYYTLKNDVHQISTTKGAADIIVGTAVNYDPPAPKIEGSPHGVATNGTSIAWTDVGDRNGVEADDVLVETDPLTDKTGYAELAQSVGDLKPQIAVDATYAYWLNGTDLVRNKLAAATPVPDLPIMVAPRDPGFIAFAINATSAYASTSDGQILKHALSVDEPVIPSIAVARDQMMATSVAVDATSVYWATSDCAIRSTGL